MHVLIDGYEGDAEKLRSESPLYELLRKAPQAMGMKAISPPSVIHYHGGEKTEDKGLSGFVMIAESHLSLHTFPTRRMLWADLFSCKAFDMDPLLRMVAEAFGLAVLHFLEIDRGLDQEEFIYDWVKYQWHSWEAK